MRKNCVYGLAAALIIGGGTIVLSSCSNDELPVGNEQQVVTETAKTYSFSVPAVMDNEAGTRVFNISESTISSRFDENDKVWVFIKNSNGDIAYSYRALYPRDVSPDGKYCRFTAENLSFYLEDGEVFEPAVDDEVYLYYGMETSNLISNLEGYFPNVVSNKDDVESMDFCLAKMKITGVRLGILTFGQIEDPTKTNFSFKNINSVFRQKLTFVDKNGAQVTPDIRQVIISSTGNKTVSFYTPFGTEPYEYGSLRYGNIVPGYDNPIDIYGNIYFTKIFNDVNKGDSIVFTAYDNEGKTYSCTKAAPEGGFHNNRYYYGDAELKWKSDNYAPIVLGSKDYTASTNLAGGIDYLIKDNPADFSIGDVGFQNSFNLENGGTVTLDNIFIVNEPYSNSKNTFMTVEGNSNLTLNLIGFNEIQMKDGKIPFIGDNGELKLRCYGNSAQLLMEITGDEVRYCGFFGFNNIDFATLPEGDIVDGTEGYYALQAIAADDDGDGDPDYEIQLSRSDLNSGMFICLFEVNKKGYVFIK